MATAGTAGTVAGAAAAAAGRCQVGRRRGSTTGRHIPDVPIGRFGVPNHRALAGAVALTSR